MSTTRVKDLTTASATNNDDFLMIDTSLGLKKIKYSSFLSTLYQASLTSQTITIRDNGSQAYNVYIYSDAPISSLTIEDIRNIKIYVKVSSNYGDMYMNLNVGACYFDSKSARVQAETRCYYGDITDSTNYNTYTGNLFVIAPFQISTISFSSGM